MSVHCTPSFVSSLPRLYLASFSCAAAALFVFPGQMLLTWSLVIPYHSSTRHSHTYLSDWLLGWLSSARITMCTTSLSHSAHPLPAPKHPQPQLAVLSHSADVLIASFLLQIDPFLFRYGHLYKTLQCHAEAEAQWVGNGHQQVNKQNVIACYCQATWQKSVHGCQQKCKEYKPWTFDPAEEIQ